jgi:hypothetical protein
VYRCAERVANFQPSQLLVRKIKVENEDSVLRPTALPKQGKWSVGNSQPRDRVRGERLLLAVAFRAAELGAERRVDK